MSHGLRTPAHSLHQRRSERPDGFLGRTPRRKSFCGLAWRTTPKIVECACRLVDIAEPPVAGLKSFPRYTFFTVSTSLAHTFCHTLRAVVPSD